LFGCLALKEIFEMIGLSASDLVNAY